MPPPASDDDGEGEGGGGAPGAGRGGPPGDMSGPQAGALLRRLMQLGIVRLVNSDDEGAEGEAEEDSESADDVDSGESD